MPSAPFAGSRVTSTGWAGPPGVKLHVLLHGPQTPLLVPGPDLPVVLPAGRQEAGVGHTVARLAAVRGVAHQLREIGRQRPGHVRTLRQLEVVVGDAVSLGA